MKIKMTSWQMEQRLNALDGCGKATGKMGYMIAKNMQALKDAIAPYMTVKNNALMKYGHPDEKNESRYIVDDPEKMKGFAAEINEVIGIEVDVDIYTVDEDTFLSWELTASEMEPLIWMVKGD